MQFMPYLSFNGNCREALTFYAELFGGTVNGFFQWDAEMIKDIPEATTDHIMHGSISLSNFALAGADQFGDNYSPGGPVSLMIDIDDDLADAKAKFDALAEGGQVMMPFGETFWADGYGFCTDRFGIQWQVNHTGSKAQQG